MLRGADRRPRIHLSCDGRVQCSRSFSVGCPWQFIVQLRVLVRGAFGTAYLSASVSSGPEDTLSASSDQSTLQYYETLNIHRNLHKKISRHSLSRISIQLRFYSQMCTATKCHSCCISAVNTQMATASASALRDQDSSVERRAFGSGLPRILIHRTEHSENKKMKMS